MRFDFDDIINEKDDVAKHTMAAQAISMLMADALPDTEFALILRQEGGIAITSSTTEPIEIMGLIGLAFKMLMEATEKGDAKCHTFDDPKEAANYVAQRKAEARKADDG